MKRVCQSIGLVLVTVFTASSVNSQQATKATDTKRADKKTVTQYVFPTSHERFKRYVSSTIGPMGFGKTALAAGWNQWRDHPTEWGQGAKGYGKRFASGMGQNAIQQTVTYGLDEAFKLDTGFEKSKRKGIFPRMKDALVQNVTSRTTTGERVISAPRLTGVYAGAIISTEAWYPERYNFKDGLRRGTTSLLTGFGINLAREFVINW